LTGDDLVIFEPNNPYEFEEGALDPLADEVKGAFSGVSTRVVCRSEAGYGAPFTEALSIWLDGGSIAASAISIGTLARLVGQFLRGRWRDDRGRSNSEVGAPRPRAAIIYDRHGNVLRVISVNGPAGEILEEEEGPPAPRGFPGPDDHEG
jgi:hypothetical protein